MNVQPGGRYRDASASSHGCTFGSPAAAERVPIVLRDGYRTSALVWRPAVPSRGTIIGLHGVQSHGGWYGYSAARLAAAGFAVWWPDRRGSGANRVGRGHARGAEQLIADVDDVLQRVRADRASHPAGEMAASQGEPPVVLLGVSWGGKLAVAAAARLADHVTALALLYPALASRIEPRRWQQRVIGAAVRLGCSRLRVRVPLRDPALFTREPQWQRFIAEDPHALHHVSLGFLQATRQLNDALAPALQRWRKPLLVLTAGRDRIVDNDAVGQLLQGAAPALLTFRCIADAEHTLEFEPNRDVWIDELIAWLNTASAADRSPDATP